AVVDEVVLGQPDGVEAQLLRPHHLLDLALDHLGVVDRGRRLQEVVRPESHGGHPSRGATRSAKRRMDVTVCSWGMRPPTFIQTDSVEKPRASRSSSRRSVTASGVPYT